MAGDSIDGYRTLASTAGWTAAIRALEQARDDRLFDDPWADPLAGSDGHAWLTDRAQGPGSQAIVIRSRYFDDFLQRVVADHGIRQVVLVAAGFDTRAFRLRWPAGTRVFDLDQAPVLDRKAAVLAAAGARPACGYAAVGVNFDAPWTDALRAAGFQATAPSCWLLEGFLFYRPEADVIRLIDQIGDQAAPGSRLGFDVVTRATLTHPLTRGWIDMQARLGAPWRSGLDDPAGVLAARGWVTDLVQVGEEAANYGRWPHPVPPRHLPDLPRHWLVTATRA